MSSNRSYFSNFLAAFRARQGPFPPVSASVSGTTTARSRPRAVPRKSISASPRNRSSSPPGSSSSDDYLSSSPFDYLSDAEWSPPPSELHRLVSKDSGPAAPPPRTTPSPSPTPLSKNPVSSATLHQKTLFGHSSSPGPTQGTAGYGPERSGLKSAASPSPGSVRYQVKQQPAPTFNGNVSACRRRRDSDSSNEGFQDTGLDRWYIGGTSTSGDERVYRLGVIKRPRSMDGISLDQMSL